MYLSRHFIKAGDELCTFEHPVNAPCFRREFELDFLPERSEITICGLGFYELFVNGVDITKGPLAPYIANTDDICYYDHYDITGHLKKGKNVIGIILGNGFRNPFGGFVWDSVLCARRYFLPVSTVGKLLLLKQTRASERTRPRSSLTTSEWDAIMMQDLSLTAGTSRALTILTGVMPYLAYRRRVRQDCVNLNLLLSEEK